MPQEDLYDDSPDGGDNAQAEAPASGKTCLLPKSAFPDAKPGDTISVEVVRVHEQEIEVQPAGQKTEEPDEPAQAPPPQGDGLSSMLED
jgi:hypothetical protein